MWVLWSVRLKLAECRGGWVPLGENSIRPSPESTAISQSIINIPTTLFGILTGSKCISEKAMAPHSSTLAWKIPWTEEPGGLQSIGSRRVGHDWATSLSLFTFMHWRRKWQHTPVFLPGAWWAAIYGVVDKIIELHLATLHIASRLTEICSSINL